MIASVYTAFHKNIPKYLKGDTSGCRKKRLDAFDYIWMSERFFDNRQRKISPFSN